MTDARSDDTLMLAYRDGDTVAFELLYGRYRKRLYRYFYYACGDRAAADEMFQDTWTRVIDARARYRRRSGFKRYLFRIAHNRLVDHWRARARMPAMDGDESLRNLPAGGPDSPEAAVGNTQLHGELMRALMALPPAQREAFLLQQEAGLSREAIASKTGVGVETVKSRLRYAVGRLRKALRPAMETQES